MDPVNNLTLLAPGTLQGTNYFFRALNTVKKITAQFGYGCHLVIEDDILRRMRDPAWHGRLDRPADGIIIFSPYAFDYESYLRLLRSQKYPCVLVRRKTQVPGVVMHLDDDVGGTLLAMEHLYRLGHRTIGYYRRSGSLYGSERKHTYRRFLREHGLREEPRLVFEQPHTASQNEWWDRFVAWLSALMTSPGAPTAFFCYSDSDALGLVEQLQQMGKRVPQDVAVVGFDDDEAAQKCRPPLTSVRLPIEEMCAAACRLIIDRQTEASPPEVVFPNSLVVRQSCGANPAGA
jgi:DNA-binding LacI/PurR family transcriptional regulator